jgi:cysteine-rich repeat protein
MKLGTQQLVACTLALTYQGKNHGLANASATTSGQEEADLKEKIPQRRSQVRHARRAQSRSSTSFQQQQHQQQQQPQINLRALVRAGDHDAEPRGPLDHTSELKLDMEMGSTSVYTKISRNEGASDAASSFAEALRLSPLNQMATRLSTERTIPHPVPTATNDGEDDDDDDDDDYTVLSAICGDGIVDSIHGEMCDDGNTINGDGCSETCCIEINRIALFPGEMYFIRDGDVLPPNHASMKLCYDSLCLSLDYLLAPGMDIIGIDVHKGMMSSVSETRMQAQFLSPNIVLPITGAGMFAKGSYENCITVDHDIVQDIGTNPMDYYLDIRTVDIPSGAVRGELKYEYEGER